MVVFYCNKGAFKLLYGNDNLDITQLLYLIDKVNIQYEYEDAFLWSCKKWLYLLGEVDIRHEYEDTF